MRANPIVLVVAIFLGGACGSDEGPSITGEDCNPLGYDHCMLPWPSSAFAIDDESTETGRKLNIGQTTLPANNSNEHVDPTPYNWHDGFSPSAPMLIAFPGGVDPSNLVTHEDYGASLTDTSPTVLINMDTGERVAHFAEVDLRADDDPDRQAVYIRPAAVLAPKTRYAVAIRKSLKGKSGGELPISQGFQALLDGKKTSNDRLEEIRSRYTEIFAALESEGISQDELVIAWDFTTVSNEFIRGDMLSAKAQALAAMGTNGSNLSFTVTETIPDGDDRIRARINGTFEAPLFLNNGGNYNPGTTVVRDSDNLPELQGMYETEFVAVIPECAYSASEPIGIIVYGHGLMGSAGQTANGTGKNTAAELCMVMIGTDMRGMSSRDFSAAAAALNDFSRGNEFFDVIIQGMINHMALAQIVRGPMAEDLFVDDMDATFVDPNKVYYMGVSQGHILGSSFVAFDPQIERGVFIVGGANYSMMLERSRDWPMYEVAMSAAYESSLDISALLSLIQMRWDLTDPATTARDAAAGIDSAPAKKYLFHIAIGDDEVPTITGEYQARTMGVPLITPSPRDNVYGLTEAGSSTSGGLVIYDVGSVPGPVGNIPPEDNDAHGQTRNHAASFRQQAHFYATGEIIHECGESGCVCGDGGCE